MKIKQMITSSNQRKIKEKIRILLCFILPSLGGVGGGLTQQLGEENIAEEYQDA